MTSATHGARARTPSAPPKPYALTAAALAAALAVDPGAGLTTAEASNRAKRFGPNLLRTRPPASSLAILIRQLASPVVGLLAAAMLLAAFFGELQQSAAVAVVLAINTAIGFWTERRAIRSMEALRRLGDQTARVRRDGHAANLPARELVPGDVVIFEAGDVVAADIRICEAAGLAADKSALTGESAQVDKSTEPNATDAPLHERSAMLFKGTSVVRGTGEGIVVGTGLSTEIGRITRAGRSGRERALAARKAARQPVASAGLADAGAGSGHNRCRPGERPAGRPHGTDGDCARRRGDPGRAADRRHAGAGAGHAAPRAPAMRWSRTSRPSRRSAPPPSSSPTRPARLPKTAWRWHASSPRRAISRSIIAAPPS